MSVTDSTDPTARGGPRDALHGAARNPVREIGAASVDADNPWLGLASFTEESQAYFFGREGEVAELTRRVQRKLLTILFGKSGLGKTSILRAGLVPRLRAQGYFPVYLRIDYGHDSPEPAEQIKQAINRAARDLGSAGGTESEGGGQWTQTGVAAPGRSIWEFLHHRDDVLKDSSGHTLIPLLIFDQFEELFTLAQSDEFGRVRAAKFIEELADLVENRPPKALEAKLDTDETIAERFDFSRSDYRVVIALREDYLAPLESLKKVMPSLSQNRLRLAPMTGTQALEAVLQPGNRLRPGRPLLSEEVAEAIVRFVAGGSELANAEVEPSLLSLICRELNEQRLAQGRSEISQDLLAGSHDTILSNFYERALSDQPDSVRRIIEDDLLTESGYRENLAEESLLRRFQAAGAAPDALAKLVNRRLLRIEERLDVRRVELTHDVLTGVVKASRDARHEREAREATERALAEQRAREEAAHRSLRRTRAIAAGCTLLAVLAFAAAIFAFMSFRRARHAERIAQQTRTVSDQARREAEGLLGFLTDDFVNELETFGRYQTIAELSQREIDYFQRLPPQLKDPETVRSGALALINHANALVYLGNLGTAGRNVNEATATLERLARGDKSVATTVVLADAYVAQISIDTVAGNLPDADTAGIRALNLLRPIAEQAHAPAEVRRAYLQALGGSVFTEGYFTGPYERAVRNAHEAARIAMQLAARNRGDVTPDADYANAGIGLVMALVNLGRDEEALREGNEALAAANRALAQHPQYGEALIAKQFIELGLAWAAADALDPAQAVNSALDGVRTSLALVQVEPQNGDYVNNLAELERNASEFMWGAGRLQDSIAYGREAMDAFGRAGEGGARPLALAYVPLAMGQTALKQVQLGDLSGTAATIAAANGFLSASALRKMVWPKGLPFSFETYIETVRAIVAAAVAHERGDISSAQRIAHATLATFSAGMPFQDTWFSRLADIEGSADFALGGFTAIEQAERKMQKLIRSAPGFAGEAGVERRPLAHLGVWLTIALAREGKRAEAAQTIGPIVTMYRGLEKRNHGDQWLPLEFAEALYAQALTDTGQHRAALLSEASGLVDHLTPAIARLHDTREWRARIEAAQRAGRGATAR